MEEKKNPGQEKLSYEQLAKNFGELHLQYQKLAHEYQNAVSALQSREFDYTSFFVSMLFKVMEHPEMYSDDFVSWVAKNIEDALRSFSDTMTSSLPETNKKEEDGGAE